MMRKLKLTYFFGGFILGALVMAAVWLCLGNQSDNAGLISSENQQIVQNEGAQSASTEASAGSAETHDSIISDESSTHSDILSSTETSVKAWDSSAVCTGGDSVSYQGRVYRAKWWTQGETPGNSDVWEDMGITDGTPAQPANVSDTPIDASELIRSAHKNGAKVLLSVGGWSYNDVPLEATFLEATSDNEKTQRFAENIIAMCDEYGFDGVDMDWEHPRVDGTSAKQYEELMLILSEKLHAKGKILTAAVLSGVTADGNIYYDAAAHTNAVLNAVDFINVMAYDGGDGERHSQYEFAVSCGDYWKNTRGLPAYKVVLGVPFYARPSWAGYNMILADVQDAWDRDNVTYNGMDVYYNGMETIKKKTRYAKENLGGIMIWELTQDTSEREKSLLQAIGSAANQVKE